MDLHTHIIIENQCKSSIDSDIFELLCWCIHRNNHQWCRWLSGRVSDGARRAGKRSFPNRQDRAIKRIASSLKCLCYEMNWLWKLSWCKLKGYIECSAIARRWHSADGRRTLSGQTKWQWRCMQIIKLQQSSHVAMALHPSSKDHYMNMCSFLSILPASIIFRSNTSIKLTLLPATKQARSENSSSHAGFPAVMQQKRK